MLCRSSVILYMLLVYYCIFGASLIEKHVFHHELSGISVALLMAVVFVSAYPVFGWKKDLLRDVWQRWPFGQWALLGLGAGIVTLAVDALSQMVVAYYSAR